MKLSICIPTYNRAAHLANCLRSIISNKRGIPVNFEICVSDNGSTDETESVVSSAQKQIAIKYRRNPRNQGIPRNFLAVVDMAEGEFVWLIGDDDLLLPDALGKLSDLIQKHPDVDYFYVNSFHLASEYVFSFPQPFDTRHLPAGMKPFSSWPHDHKTRFMDLIDPRISFDFLGGMYLSVFRRENWILNKHILDEAALTDSRVFSYFDNTFPHIKIFAKAFAHSNAFFRAEPLSICLSGAREWAPLYRFVRSVRLVEALDEYRKNGLPYAKYIRCKNFALRTFLPDFLYMVLKKNSSGFRYLRPTKSIFSGLLYPNFYFSICYVLGRKMKGLFTKYLYGNPIPSN